MDESNEKKWNRIYLNVYEVFFLFGVWTVERLPQMMATGAWQHACKGIGIDSR